MTMQTILVLVIVAGAVAYLASRYVRMFGRKGGGCGGSCGCSKGKAAVVEKEMPLHDLGVRRRPPG